VYESHTIIVISIPALPNGIATCSLELSTAYFQSASSVFLSQQISQQYFQPLIFSQTNRLKDSTPAWAHIDYCGLPDGIAMIPRRHGHASIIVVCLRLDIGSLSQLF
jgi:hypothetical protein